MAEIEFETLANIRQVSRDPARSGKFDRLITFKAGDGRVGAVLIPEEGATDRALSEAVSGELKRMGAFSGRKLRATI